LQHWWGIYDLEDTIRQMKRWHSFQIPNFMPRHYALHLA